MHIIKLCNFDFLKLEFEGATRPSNSSPSGGVGGPSAQPYGSSAHSCGPLQTSQLPAFQAVTAFGTEYQRLQRLE